MTGGATHRPAASARSGEDARDDARAGGRADLVAAAGAVGLVAAAAVVARLLALDGRPVRAGAAPLFAHWLPHVGPGTPLAVAAAGLVIWRGPTLAARLPWRTLLACTYAAATGWTLSLALVDGWQRGLAGRLTTRFEYLSEVGGVNDVPAMLRGFTGRILDGGPDSWTTHVAGHPPGALLVFVALDRVGLGGGGSAALACVLIGALAAVAVPIALRALGAESTARAAVPFLVLFPGAIWIGASADGLFTGIAAGGLALLAVGATRPSRWAAAGAGILLGYCLYLSYGLLLLTPLALTTLALALTRPRPAPTSPAILDLWLPLWVRRPLWGAPQLLDRRGRGGGEGPGRRVRWGGLPWVVAGIGAVVAAFSVAGFWWPDGFRLVHERYYQGLASHRPYGYWVWANLAALVLCAGPAVAPILRRAVSATASWGPGTQGRVEPPPLGGRWLDTKGVAAVLVLAATTVVLIADVSGLSKAEVERIWLPFAVWLPAGAALLPDRHRRGWLAAQAITALLVNHLLLTTW